MKKNAQLFVPLDYDSIDLNCMVDYNDLELGEKKTLALEVLEMSYSNFQELFKILTLKGEEQPHEVVKKFCNLKVEGEMFILSGCIVEEVFRDRIRLFCDRILLNEV